MWKWNRNWRSVRKGDQSWRPWWQRDRHWNLCHFTGRGSLDGGVSLLGELMSRWCRDQGGNWCRSWIDKRWDSWCRSLRNCWCEKWSGFRRRSRRNNICRNLRYWFWRSNDGWNRWRGLTRRGQLDCNTSKWRCWKSRIRYTSCHDRIRRAGTQRNMRHKWWTC